VNARATNAVGERRRFSPASVRRGGRHGRDARGTGFTLIELLVVVLIVLVLVAIVGGVGFKVIANQKSKVTLGVLQSLDRSLEEYMVQNGGNIPPFNTSGNIAGDYEEVPGPNATRTDAAYFEVYPVGTGTVLYPVRPDVAVFLKQALGYGQVQSIVSGLTDRFVRVTTLRPADIPQGNIPGRASDPTPSVVDAWSQENWEAPWDAVEVVPSAPDGRLPLQQLVFYVHPKNPLAQEYYGKCVNERPYFMSAGPDMFYGTKSELPYIIARYGLVEDQLGAETPLEFKQRVLKTAREDNLYSYPVRWDFATDANLLGP
jgi:prepilin-type N-terminal cleavage/methylation domain-containing protein